MIGDLAVWQQVVADPALLERADAVDASDVSAVAALRRDYAADQVAVALERCVARRKAVAKFGDAVAHRLIADVQGVEQASGSQVAAYKAKRLRDALGNGVRVADVCCGIGGDAIALAGAGLDVVAVDREPVRAWMARCNTMGQADAVCMDAAGVAVDGVALHIDPARRDEAGRRRSWRLDDYQPGPALIGELLERSGGGALKLSPGVDVEALPWTGEIEFISDGGRLVQAVLWSGRLASAPRRAALLDGSIVHTLAGEAGSMPLGALDRYVFAIDPAVERAGLIGLLCEQVGLPVAHPKLGLLTGGQRVESPWLTGFEVVERMPWRPKRVKQWLAGSDGGLVEVKTRGKACDPDREQRRLRGEGRTTYTVFVLRFDTKVQALICKRLG